MVQKILDNYQSILNSINKQTELDQEEIKEKVNKRVDEYAGLLTKASAAYAIAKENNVETGFEPKPTELVNVQENQFKLRVKGIVKQAWPLVEFETGARSGCVRNFVLDDNTKQMRFVIWNNKELTEKIEVGQEITIEGAYSKTNNNFLEIHAGDYAKINLGEIIKGIEKIEKSFLDAQEGDIISGEVTIQTIYPAREFHSGKVRNAIFKFGEKMFNLVVWNEQTSCFDQFQNGDEIDLKNVQTKINKMSGNIEFHISSNSEINKLI